MPLDLNNPYADLVPAGKTALDPGNPYADLVPAKQPAPHTTAPGIAASLARGAAPYAAGAAIGAGIGVPFAGIGAAPGALAGIGATALSQFGLDIANWLGLPHTITPQEATDRALDVLGIKRPSTTLERALESGAGFAASMGGVRVMPPVTSGSQASRLFADFERHGVTPTVPTIGQSRTAARLRTVLEIPPISGPVIRAAMIKSLNETSEAATRAAAGYGQARDIESAGAEIRNAIQRFAADQSQAKADYRQFTQAMVGAPPAPLPKTLQILRELMGRYREAPGLVGIFTRSPIAALRRELEPRTATIPPTVSPILDESGHPVVLSPGQKVVQGGKLAMSDLEELRSQIGAQIGHPGLGPDDVPKSQLKRLYAALTFDMEAAARAQGPGALNALVRANARYGIRMRMIDLLRPLEEGASDTRAFTKLNSAAESRGTANANLLRAARQVMTPQEWGDLGATIISRLGEPTNVSKDILADNNFSVSSFGTNWAKLSTRAKNLLFGVDEPESLRGGLEALARIAQAHKNIGRMENVSRSGEVLLLGGTGAGLIEAALHAFRTGDLAPVAAAAGIAGTGYGVAKLLMSPRFARWLYQLPRIRAMTPQAAAQTGINAFIAIFQPEESQTSPGLP